MNVRNKPCFRGATRWIIALVVPLVPPALSAAQDSTVVRATPDADFQTSDGAMVADSARQWGTIDVVAGPASVLAGPTFDPNHPPRVVMGFWDVMHESIFGPASRDDWRPLSLRTFFSEGWDSPFVNSPEGTKGAPKQGWLNAPLGMFGRIMTLNMFYTNHLYDVHGVFLAPNALFMPVHTFTTGNQYAGYTITTVPLNARLELLLGTVFIDSRKSSPNGGYVGNWGDSAVQARFRLIEKRDFSFLVTLGDRIPTGKAVNGSGINFVTPGMEAWWNFAPNWVLRGGSSVNILTGRKTATTVYANQLSIGRYLTTQRAAFFKQLAVHVTATALSDVSGGQGHVNDMYIFPGFRFGLGSKSKWFVFGGVQVPVAGPKPYVWQPQFSIARGY